MRNLTNYWIFFPALFFYVAVLQNATNIPIMDDYEAILQWLHDFNHADGWHWLLLLFQQHNEHRLLHSRIVYLMYYWVAGGINFRGLIIIADLQLAVVAWISAYFIRKTGIRYWQLAACIWMFCLYDLNTYESASIAMYGMQNYGVVMLFFLSLFFYERQKPVIAAIFQLLLIFSSGNGFIGAFFLYLFMFGAREKDRFICFITGFCCTLTYFYSYNFAAQDGRLPLNPLTMLVFFIRNAGAYIDFDASLFTGILILGYSSWVFPYKRFREFMPMVCITGFVVSSMVAAAIMRSCLTWAQFQGSRYLIYPQLLVGCTVIFTFIKFNKHAKTNSPIVGHRANLRKELPIRKSRVRKNAQQEPGKSLLPPEAR